MPAALSCDRSAVRVAGLVHGATSMPRGPAESFTPATAAGLALPAPPAAATAAPASTASATPAPAHTTCFRPRRDSLRAVTVTPPFIVLQRPIQAKTGKTSTH